MAAERGDGRRRRRRNRSHPLMDRVRTGQGATNQRLRISRAWEGDWFTTPVDAFFSGRVPCGCGGERESLDSFFGALGFLVLVVRWGCD